MSKEDKTRTSGQDSAEIAAERLAPTIIDFGNKILELVGFSGDISAGIKETITKEMAPLITNIINKAFTEERADTEYLREELAEIKADRTNMEESLKLTEELKAHLIKDGLWNGDAVKEAAEERTQHSKTEREHSQMAAFIYTNSLTHFHPEEAMTYGLITGHSKIKRDDGDVNTVDYSSWLTASAERYSSVKNAGGG